MFKHLAVVGALVSGVLTGVAAESLPAVAAGSTGGYVSVPATRLLDTYAGVGVPHQWVPAHGTVTVRFAGRSPVPSSAVAAVTFTLSAISPTASGWLTAYPAGHTRPRAVDLAVTAHQNAATPVTIPLGSNGAVTVYNGTPGTLGLLADVTGYYRAGTATPGGYVPLAAQTRVLDTYAGVGVPKQWVAGGHALTVPVAGRGGIPGTGAASVVLTLAATGATRNGWVTAYPAGASRPTAVDLAVNAGHNAADLVTVPLGSGGAISLYNASTGSIGLLADVLGYYRTGMPATTGSFVALPKQTRVLDTYAGVGAPKGTVYETTPLTLHLAGRAGIPSTGAGAVIATLTATGVTQPGWIKAFPTDVGWPNAVSLALNRYQNSSALVALPLSATGDVTFAPSFYAYLLLDVVGYTRAPAAPASVAASGSGTAISLSWTAATDPGVTRYVVRRTATTTAPATMDDGALVADVAAATTAVTDRNLTPGTRYRYSVFAVDAGLDVSPRTVATATTPARAVSWDAGTKIDHTRGDPQTASCISATFCAAGDYYGSLLTFDGSRWHRGLSDQPVVWVSVSCATSTFCAAIGACAESCQQTMNVVSTFDGSRWSAPAPTLPDARSAERISCPQPGSCVEVGTIDESLVTAVWSGGVEGPDTVQPASIASVEALSCVSATDCLAVGGGGLLRYDGSQWSTETVTSDSEPLATVSCPPGGTACVVLDQLRRSVTVTWTAGGIVDGIPTASGLPLSPDDLSCTAATSCLAADGGGDVARLDATGWHPVTPKLPADQYLKPPAVSCGTGGFCLVVQQTRGAAVAIQGETVQRTMGFDPPRANPRRIACLSADECIVLSGYGQELTYQNGTWHGPRTVLPSPNTPHALSCALGGDFCMATSGTGAAVFDGSTWTRVAPPPGLILALSCPSAGFCAGELGKPTGSVTGATTYHSGSWSAPAPLDTYLGPGGVFCGPPAFCEPGGRTAGEGAPNGDGGATLSCPPSSVPVCVAVVGLTVRLFDGVRWTAVTSLPRTSQNGSADSATSITCASSGFCLIAIADGTVFRFNGSTASAVGTLDVPDGNEFLFGPHLTCVSSTACFATTYLYRYGLAYRYS